MKLASFYRVMSLFILIAVLAAGCAGGGANSTPAASATGTAAVPVTGDEDADPADAGSAGADPTGADPTDADPAAAEPTAALPDLLPTDMPAAATATTAAETPGAAGEAPTAAAETPAAAAAGDTTVADLPPIDCIAPAPLTPPLTEGPYYSSGAPERTNLIEPGIPGTPLHLSGYVLDVNCQPIPGALVDFWQADGAGNYDNQGYRLRGHQFTDQNGRYVLETVIPGEYPGRTPHIHVKVQAPNGPLVTSQVFLPESAQNQTDRIFDESLIVEVVETREDGVVAVFNFVVPVE